MMRANFSDDRPVESDPNLKTFSLNPLIINLLLLFELYRPSCKNVTSGNSAAESKFNIKLPEVNSITSICWLAWRLSIKSTLSTLRLPRIVYPFSTVTTFGNPLLFVSKLFM